MLATGAPADRASSFNFLTTTSRWEWLRQRLGFLVARQPDVTARLAGMLSGAEQLRMLNFLHTARWVDVGRFPRVADGQPRERRSPRSVLFCSTFNGDRDTYIRCFMEAFPEGVYDIWGPSVGWPGFPRPGTSKVLFGWVTDQFIRSDHDYRAYPQATTNDVRAALAVRREVRSLVADLRTADGTDQSPWTDAALDGLASRVQHCLGRVDGTTPRAWPPAAPGGSIHGLVALLPIRAGREASVRKAIEALPTGVDSPFASVPGTHFARLLVIDRDAGIKASGSRRKLSYLELAADFDGASDQFFADVFARVGRLELWGHCLGVDADDSEAFAEIARRGTCPPLLEYLDYPGHDLHTVLDALEIQQRLHATLASRRGVTVDRSTFASLLGRTFVTIR